jgi:hypothetical protein
VARVACVALLALVTALLASVLADSAPDHDANQALGAAQSLASGTGHASPFPCYALQHTAAPVLPVPQTIVPPGGAFAPWVALALAPMAVALPPVPWASGVVLACVAGAAAQAAFLAWNAATVAAWFVSWRYLLPLLPLCVVAGGGRCADGFFRRARGDRAAHDAAAAGTRLRRQPLPRGVGGRQCPRGLRIGVRGRRGRGAARAPAGALTVAAARPLGAADRRRAAARSRRGAGARSGAYGEGSTAPRITAVDAAD